MKDDFKKKLWAGLLIMALLTPVGLLLPELLKGSDAWGEWDGDTIKQLLGFVPEGMAKYDGLWSAPIPDYTGPAQSTVFQMLVYIVSAIVGLFLCKTAIALIARAAIRTQK